MEALTTVLIVIGFVILGVGSLWFLLTAFAEGLFWGLVCLFTGIGDLIFLVMHWDRAKRPFFLMVVGALIAALGGVILRGHY